MKLFSLLCMLLISMVISVSATTYYVDNTAGSDNNSGTTTTAAWKSISKVNSFSFAPGDNILFKRGSTWTETLKPKSSGTSSAYITFGSYGTGNAPLLDMKNTYAFGVYISSLKYLNIKDFKVQNCKAQESSGAFFVAYSSYITIANGEAYITGRAGIFIQNSSYVTALKNNLHTVTTALAFQTDGIYSQRNAHNIYDGNTIIISNPDGTGHDDAIQMYTDTTMIIRNNYIEQNNTKTANAQGIYSSVGGGVFLIYNNTCYGMYTTSSLIKFLNYQSATNTVKIYSNTVYGGKGELLQIDDPNAVIKNNIIYTTGALPVIKLMQKPVPGNVNYNIYHRSTTGQVVVSCTANTSKTALKLSEWQAMGNDKNSFEGSPIFNDVAARDFKLKTGSVGIDKGTTLGSPFNSDAIGTARPSGNSYDMGAFELKSSTVVVNNKFNRAVLDKVAGSTEDASMSSEAPTSFELSQNYPNPFNPSTKIRYALPVASMVTIKVYDILGKEVATLANEQTAAGVHEVEFNASNLASGTYIYRIIANNFVVTKKMMLIK